VKHAPLSLGAESAFATLSATIRDGGERKAIDVAGGRTGLAVNSKALIGTSGDLNQPVGANAEKGFGDDYRHQGAILPV